MKGNWWNDPKLKPQQFSQMDPSHLVKAWMAGRAPLKHAMPGVPNTVMTGYKVGLKQNPSDLQEFFHTLFSNRSAI